MSSATDTVRYRQADESDIPGMARIRAAEWGTKEYWRVRIAAYMNCALHPRQALMPRVNYVALEGDSMVGLIAGHLTRRHGCEGELEWINVIPERRALPTGCCACWRSGLRAESIPGLRGR